MILEKIFLNLEEKNIFLIFTFSKQSYFGIFFYFWLKTPQNYKSCSKNGQNHEFALLSFTFHQKK